MSGRGILDADMRTLTHWIAQGWHWWVEEMQALVPARWRFRQADALPRLVLRNETLSPAGNGRGEPKAGLRAAIIVPRQRCLSRTIERPALNQRDLQRMLKIEGDRLLPFPAGSTLVAGRVAGPAREPGRIEVEIAGLPVDVAQEIAVAVAASRVVPVRVLMEGEAGAPPSIDFAPALREAGLLAKARSATPWVWGLVGLLVALNLAMFIWRDVAAVARFEAIVQAQQPALSVSQTITRRVQRDQALARQSLGLRRTHDALGGLAAVSRALPDGAWLQRYVWDGPTVRLTGYKPPKTDVATALRRSDRFAEVRSMTDESQATVPAGDPFDLNARVLVR